jgi:hypothetical protein
VWLAPYHYRDKLYRIVVNARTGEVVGTRPYSFWKPVLLILAILLTIGAIAGIAALFGAFTHSQGRRDLPPRPPAVEVRIAAGTEADSNAVTGKPGRDLLTVGTPIGPRLQFGLQQEHAVHPGRPIDISRRSVSRG